MAKNQMRPPAHGPKNKRKRRVRGKAQPPKVEKRLRSKDY